jgi:glycosyltransferase involved in cell wall biosynthesis
MSLPSLDDQAHSPERRVAILLCTCQGQRFLAEQLDSIGRQTHPHWTIVASDDGSTDDTLNILERYRARWGAEKLEITHGPRRGFVANFLSLACREGIHADYFAFCDQDDIWATDKLERAVHWLDTVPAGMPAMYGSRTRAIDAQGRPMGLSRRFTRPPGFKNALVQSIVGGNTIVFNESARRLLMAAGDDVAVASHDWWTYLAVTSAGGRVFYDDYPSVDYRQHGANAMGENTRWRSRLKRAWQLMRGQLGAWNGMHLNALERLPAPALHEHATALRCFREARNVMPPISVFWLCKSGVYRQTLLENLGLVAAALLRRL